MSPQGVSLKPSDAVAGGGAFDDVDVLITKCRFRSWDYNGTIATPVLGLEVSYKNETDDHEFSQVYSAGDMSQFVPSPDGKFAVPVGNQPGLNDSTNAMLWLGSVVNAGFPENKIGEDVSVFEGTRVHVNNVPQPKRGGKGVKLDKDGKPYMVLTVSKINGFSDGKAVVAPKVAGAKKAAPAAAAAQAASAPAEAPAGGDGSVFSKAVGTTLQILTDKGGTVVKAAIAQAAFMLLAKDPERTPVVQLCYKDEFLSGQLGEVPWKFDGATVSL